MDQSIFAKEILDEKKGPPPEINLFNEKNIGQTLLKLISKKLIKSAHDVSLGGILVALTKMAISGNKGFKLNKLKFLMNKFEYFFSEDQARYIIELREENLKLVKKLLNENSVHFDELGLITKNEVIIDGEPNFSVDEIKSANNDWLKKFMES